MTRERTKRVLGDDFFDVPTFGVKVKELKPIDPSLACEKHCWTGDPFYGPCPSCRKELHDEAQAKKLHTWERYRDLVSLTETLLPEFVRGCHNEEELMAASAKAVRVARNTLALLEVDLPKESRP